MIQENGVVIRVENQRMWVETQRKTACESCSANKGCATATLGKVVGNKPNIIELANHENLQVGDGVVLGMDERALVKGSFAVYIAPLLFVLVFALVGEYLQSSLLNFAGEGVVLLFAVLGLACGFFWVRYFFSRRHCPDKSYSVTVSRRVL